MKTAVTGGTGFIGSHLVKRLVDEARDVVVIGEFPFSNAENLAELGVTPERIEFRQADLTEYAQTASALHGVDTVFHLAAVIGSLTYLHGTASAERTALQRNLAIDANVFRVCLEKRIDRIIYASSTAVYPLSKQQTLGVVLTEEDLTSIEPDGGYGWSKLMGEIQLDWMKEIKIGIARIFNVYGMNEPLEARKAHVIGDFCRKVQSLSGGELRIQGDGTQTRDFLYVTDCVEALLQLEKKAAKPPLKVNIGSGEAVSVGELAQKIIALSQKPIRVTFDPAQPTGPRSRTASITRARTVLKWQPSVSLDEGLKRTYTWIQRRLKQEQS